MCGALFEVPALPHVPAAVADNARLCHRKTEFESLNLFGV